MEWSGWLAGLVLVSRKSQEAELGLQLWATPDRSERIRPRPASQRQRLRLRLEPVVVWKIASKSVNT